jgi:putative DNA primase/helicase
VSMNESYPKQSNFREMLLSRHDATDTICVSAAMLKTGGKYDGDFIVDEHFCDGVDEAADLIERSSQRDDIAAIWTNLQRLIPGSRARKKYKTIDAYTNILVDIDRRIKKDAAGVKINATEAERVVLRETADKVASFLSPQFGHATFADSGNGFHLSWRCEDMKPDEGREYYRELLAVLRHRFEQPDVNMEIDGSLFDDTQVVTVWGTWNRKYENTAERPQRQSELIYLPGLLKINYSDIMVICAENPAPKSVSQPKMARGTDADKLRANPEWLENYGVPDLIDFWSPEISYESIPYDKADGVHHPITPCPCHKDEEFHEHSTQNHCEIIEYNDGTIGIGCFSRDFGLRTVIAKLNQIKGGNYPHLIYEEESLQELFDSFGVQEDVIVTPVGELCHEVNCDCGRAHVIPQKPVELFDQTSLEYEMVRRDTDDGYNAMMGIKMSDVKSRKLEFLWKGRIPEGKGVVFHGLPGTAKSMAALSIAAIVSTGEDWPDGAENGAGEREVLIAATEDDAEDTIKPRLQAMGANMDNITQIKRVMQYGASAKQRRLLLKEDTKMFLKYLRLHPKTAVVILDPIQGFFGGADGNSNQEIRPILEAIAEVCRLTRVNFIAIVHENKREGAGAIDKILGAGALSQVFRVALRFSRDPENKDGLIIATTKANLTKTKGGLRYMIAEEMVTLDDGNSSLVGKVAWGEQHELTSDDVIAAARDKEKNKDAGGTKKIDLAKQMLNEQLATGPKLLRELYELGLSMGIGETSDAVKKTVQRARRDLGIYVIKPPNSKGPFWAAWEAADEPWFGKSALVEASKPRDSLGYEQPPATDREAIGGEVV